jgi:hypothetical protein
MNHSMDHFTEDKNIKLLKDCIFDGNTLKAGSKLNFLLRQGEYCGFKMRVPPPEFEALLFFNAIESAAKAETFKKLIKINMSTFDGLPEIDLGESNKTNFYSMCQSGMAAVAFSVSAIESWANNSIALHGLYKGKPTELTLERPGKTNRIILSNSVASDPSIPIRPKLFQLVPQVFSCPPLKEHSTLRNRVGEIIEERNIVMHMQNILKISDNEVERLNYSIKLFKVSSFVAPEAILNYITYIYDNSKIKEVVWASKARKELAILKELI